jgi:cyanophycinase
VSDARGPLVIIGGHEDREGERVILKEVASHLDGRSLLLCAAASKSPEEYVELYRAAFADLGVNVRELKVDDQPLDVDEVGGVFFSGGDQQRLSETVRGTKTEGVIRSIWNRGGVIAGTSAGASVMSDTMMASGASETTPTEGGPEFGAGLGLLSGVLIDQHFAERGRIGRLATAVKARRDLLGIGIDEDTAIVVADAHARIIGAGGVYVLDGRESGAEGEVGLRLLIAGEGFDLE